MKHSLYPYAPLVSREIPGRATTASFEYGTASMASFSVHVTAATKAAAAVEANRLGDASYDLERRLNADIVQLNYGPLMPVTR